MKKHVLLMLLVLIGLGSTAQIGIIDLDGNFVEGTEIHLYLDTEDEHIESDFRTQNLSSDTNTYNMKRYELEYIEGSIEYYCWTLCLNEIPAGTQTLSVFPSAAGLLTLAPDGLGPWTAPAFHFKPEGNTGIATYRYIIFNTEDENDSAYVDMVYHVGTVGVNEYDNSALSNVYPSPANNYIYVNLNSNIENARFEIFSMVGTRMQAEQIQNVNGKITIDVSLLSPGIYMLQEMESQITRKFIISR